MEHHLENTEEDNESVTFFLAGDVMPGRGIDQILPHSVDPRLYENYVKNASRYVELAEQKNGPIPSEVPFDYVWGVGLDILEKAEPDVRIVNLESAATTHNKPLWDKFIHYRMHPENVDVLTVADIDICTLANNHVLDWRTEGLHDTIRTLSETGIAFCGAGRHREYASKPASITLDAARILVFSYAHPSSGVRRGWAAMEDRPGINMLKGLNSEVLDNVSEHVNAHRRDGDLVVLSIHWGGNWGYRIPEKQRRFAHALIDEEVVDLIHGHSSHHPKGIEVYNGHPIFYGCGDLINDYEGIGGRAKYRGDLRMLYLPRLDAKGKLESLGLVPVKSRRLQLQATSDEEREWLLNTVKRESKELDTDLLNYISDFPFDRGAGE